MVGLIEVDKPIKDGDCYVVVMHEGPFYQEAVKCAKMGIGWYPLTNTPSLDLAIKIASSTIKLRADVGNILPKEYTPLMDKVQSWKEHFPDNQDIPTLIEDLVLLRMQQDW